MRHATRYRTLFAVALTLAAAPLAAFAGVALNGGWQGAAEHPPTFALVSYSDRLGALHAEELDSGLTATDCRFALQQAARFDVEPFELVTCELER